MSNNAQQNNLEPHLNIQLFSFKKKHIFLCLKLFKKNLNNQIDYIGIMLANKLKVHFISIGRLYVYRLNLFFRLIKSLSRNS